ncbi:phage major capsid protein [Novosphingobium sp. YJ-S2-02]|uniref:Phage major capsid protein n=1 Tax=Novosphingobium aureum TaxID=2792964 RepID=A0A931HDQ0_9SPHN|nr:phage major capsid protein [Novosphingobium aureum]MBH0114210.1 phage major capsid protein [Novosphingobium aureum]
MKTSDLIEARGAIVARMTAADAADDNAAFDAATAELAAHDVKIERAKKIDAAERSESGRVLAGGSGEFAELRNQSLRETLAYKIDPTSLPGETRAKVEREQAMLVERAGKKPEGVHIATELFEKRAVQTTANSGAILPTDFRPDQFVSALTASTVLNALGATTLSGLTGNVEIPRETGSPAVGWVAENSALPTGNATFDSLTLSPHHVGVISEMSRNMIMQASPSIEMLLRQMMARDIALEIDRAGLNGSGIGAEPRGLLNDPDIDDVAFTTDLFDLTADMMAAADLANVMGGRGFLSTNSVKGNAMHLRDGDGHAITLAETFHNETALFTNQAPNDLGTGNDEHALVYGYWPDFLIGIWSQLDILVNPFAETAYSKGNILIRTMATVDFGVRRPASFVKASGVTAV